MAGGVGWITPEVKNATPEIINISTGMDDGVYKDVKRRALTSICTIVHPETPERIKSQEKAFSYFKIFFFFT